MKRNEVLTYATMWMTPENTLLSERSQSQMTTSCMISLIRNVRIEEYIEAESGFVNT